MILFILALIVEYLVIPELVGASKNLYLLGRVSIPWMIAGLALEGFSLFCYALLTRDLLPPQGRPGLSRLFRIDLAAAAVAHMVPAGTIGSAGVGFQLFTSEGLDGTDVGVMMATKGMGSTIVLNVLLWLSLVISIPLSGFKPIYATVAIVGAVLLALIAALIIGLTRGAPRAARILHAAGDKIPGVGGDRLEKIVFQADESLRSLARNRRVMIWALTWASLNWLLDAASLWCFIAAFGAYANPVGLFAAYGIANVLGAIPITPAGLGVIDSVTPVLLIGFGLTRSVATLGVLAWRLVNFWLPIPTGVASYISLRVPRGSLRSWAAMRQALADMFGRNRSGGEQAGGDGAGDDSGKGEARPAGTGPGTTAGRASRPSGRSAPGKFDHRHEELVDLPDGRDELLHVHRLGDVRVGVQLVAAQDVLLGRGGGQDHHRHVGELGVRLDLLQDLPPVVLGQVEVEQDQVDLRRGGVRAAAVQEVQGLFAVPRHVQPVADLVVLERFPGHQLVAGVVLNEQDFDRFQVTHAVSLRGWCWCSRRLVPAGRPGGWRCPGPGPGGRR